MMQEVSLSACVMCEAPGEMSEVCSNEMPSLDLLMISQTPHSCCEVKVVSIIGTEEYLPAQNGSTVKSAKADMIPHTLQHYEYPVIFSDNFFSDISPPAGTTPEIFLCNNCFRI